MSNCWIGRTRFLNNYLKQLHARTGKEPRPCRNVVQYHTLSQISFIFFLKANTTNGKKKFFPSFLFVSIFAVLSPPRPLHYRCTRKCIWLPVFIIFFVAINTELILFTSLSPCMQAGDFFHPQRKRASLIVACAADIFKFLDWRERNI